MLHCSISVLLCMFEFHLELALTAVEPLCKDIKT